MEFFRIKRDIPFMSYGKLTTSISLITFILAIFFLYSRGLNLSIEFTGGTLMEVSYDTTVNPNIIRNKLITIGITDATVQNYGSSNTLLIRLTNKHHDNLSNISQIVFKEIQGVANGGKLKSMEFIGPEIGQDLLINGLLAILFVCVGVIIYLAIRFQWRFAISAIIANMHDVVIILGFFAYTQLEFSLTVLAAVLAVLGYSVNESVVVFDRIRENFKISTATNVADIINNAITATISRTIITHGCTEIMVLSMFFFGGASLHNFSIALTIGILFGIYSSVLVSSPLIMLLGIKRDNVFTKKKNIKKQEIVV